MKTLTDNFGRVHDYLRISLTDRCNLNCLYCNPLTEQANYEKANNLLNPVQLQRIVNIFLKYFGFKKIRFTGGEPLVRKNADSIFGNIKQLRNDNDFELSLTTNGTLLEQKIELLKEAGVSKINISLDSLRKDVFNKLTGHDNLDDVLIAINKALSLDYFTIKINCVVIKGINDNEILDFVEYFADKNVSLRFIEYMPFTNNKWNDYSFISYKGIKKLIEIKYKLNKIPENQNSVSRDYFIEGLKCTVGFISSISEHFCATCNRLRISATGNLRLCLFGSKDSELALKPYLENSEFTDKDISDIISSHMKNKLFEHPPVEELASMDFNYMLKAGG